MSQRQERKQKETNQHEAVRDAGSRLNNRNGNHNEMNNDNNTDIADNNDIDINNHIEMTDNISNQSTHNNRIEINNGSQDCRRKRWSHHEINILVEFILDKKIEIRKLNRLDNDVVVVIKGCKFFLLYGPPSLISTDLAHERAI
nr:10851_t:CDS:2 [Entrophospora candida]